AGDDPVATTAGQHHVAEVGVVEVDRIDRRRAGREGEATRLAPRRRVVLAHVDELLSRRVVDDPLVAAVAAADAEAGRLLQRAASAHHLHLIALVDVDAGGERARPDAGLADRDGDAVVAGVVRAVEGDAAVVRVLRPDEGDVAALRGAGHVRRLRGGRVGQLGGPGLGRPVEADHVHVVAGGRRRVVGGETAQVVDVAAVVVVGGPHRVAADEQRPAARVGVDILEVVAGEREGRTGHDLVVRVERHDVDVARSLLEERKPRAAARDRRDRQRREAEPGAVVVDLVVGVAGADVDLGDPHAVSQRRRKDAAVTARPEAAVRGGNAGRAAVAGRAAGCRAAARAAAALGRPARSAAAGLL